MSFILDALKKSETDRQQNGTAEFAGVPTSTAKSGAPKWLWIVGVLLTINLAVLIGLFVKPDNRVASIQTALPTTNADSKTPEQKSASQASFEEKVAVARRSPPEQQTAVTRPEPRESTPNRVKPVLISQNPTRVAAEDLYPSFDEMRTKGTMDLPDLHIDIHVFNQQPEDRFVFINMSKLREGEQLAEGPVVAEITPEGVVLGHQGQFFVLPRD
jgi:general secretion pathway protein B